MDKNELIRLKNELVDRESFQKYINEHKIRSANEFSKHSSTLYKRLNSLGFSREVIYYGNDKPTIRTPKRHFIGFDDLESFQSYINENKLGSPSDFYKKDSQLFDRMVRKGFRNLVVYYNTTETRAEILKKEQEFRLIYNNFDNIQKLILDNNINSVKEFQERFPKIYYTAKKKLKIMAKLRFANDTYSLWTRRFEKSSLNTLKEFQEFIDLWGFKQNKEICHHNYRVYNKLCNLGFNGNIKFNNSFLFKLWDIDRFQNIIDVYSIVSMDDLEIKIYNMYVYVSLTGIYKNLSFKEDKNPIPFKANTLEDFQNLITGMRLISEEELINFYEPLYNELCRLGFKDSVSFYKNQNKPGMEEEMEKFLIEKKINFVCQKKFDFLGGYMSLDFYLPDLKLAIECQGAQHFMPIEAFGGERDFKPQQERDIRKYKKCLENNIRILYYSNKKQLISGNRKRLLEIIPTYFSKVFLDLDEIYLEIQRFQDIKINNLL